MEFLAFNQVDGVVAEVMRFKIERKFQRGRERKRRNDKVCEVNGCFFCVKYM
jgi:hypothetical protein